MDLDRALVSAILRDGKDALRSVVEKGVRDEHLNGGAREAYVFIQEFLGKYQAFPTASDLEGSTGFSPIPIESPCAFYADEVLNRRLHGELSKTMQVVVGHLENRDPKSAYLEYEEGVRKLRKDQHVVEKSVNLLSLAPDFLAYYDRLKAGITGILTPWRTLNEATLGFWPEDFILIVARLGVGKTWMLTLLAEHAWANQKKRVLFASTEMSREKILQRFYSLHLRLPYDDFRKARLGAFAEEKFRKTAQELAESDGFFIVGGEFDFRIETLEAAIDDCEPDIVILDGAYLMRSSGDGRTEQAANSFDEIKRLAKRRRIPIIASTQFNRQMKGNNAASASVDKIALSDAAGWNADVVLGMIQTEDMRRDGRMTFKFLKVREGVGEDVECVWDFTTMSFVELGDIAAGGDFQGQPRASADDPYGTGLDFTDDGEGGNLPF